MRFGSFTKRSEKKELRLHIRSYHGSADDMMLYSKKMFSPNFPWMEGTGCVDKSLGLASTLVLTWQFTTDVRSQVSIQLHVASNFLAGNTTQFPKCSCREILQNYDCFINFQVWSGRGKLWSPFGTFRKLRSDGQPS